MKSELTTLNKAIKDRTDRLACVMNEIYEKFKSATHYRRIRVEVPPGAVSIELTCKWCDYTAYCEPVEGSRLLFQKELLISELQQLNRRRNELLAPLRRTLAWKKYEKAWADYQQRLAEYEAAHPRWLAAKEEWERSRPKEVVSVGGIKPSELAKVTDLAAHFPLWGAAAGRNPSWRFFIDGKTKKGNHHVWCERPAHFAAPEPIKPKAPTKPTDVEEQPDVQGQQP